MPKKKTKKPQNKSKYEVDDIPRNDICRECEDWTKPVCSADPGAVCEDCPHSYHDRCIDKQFRNKDFDTCQDLDHDCDNDSDPIFFALGPEIDHVAQKRKKHKKGRSNKISKHPKKKAKSKIPGVHKKTYKSFKYCHIEYKIGDDVVLNIEDQGEQIARIKEIYVYNNDLMPQLEILWFWRSCEVGNGINYTEDDSIESHELYLGDNYIENDKPVNTLINSGDNQSSKALIVTSSEEYLKELKKKENKNIYHNIYWCTHAYNDHSKKKSLLPPGAITSHQTIGITPSKNRKKNRKRDRKTIITNALNDAGKALMLSSVPSKLPCREKEHDEILRYMKNNIVSKGHGSGLYISGMPGTGKTATVRQIANELQRLTVGNNKLRGGLSRGKKKKKDKLPNFEFHEINAMKLPTPAHIYTELAKKLIGKPFAPNTAVKKLSKYFSTKDRDRKICVLLVDELDYLLTRQQKVIYNIFDWPTKTNAKLVVIGIANTMDLPERLLPRVSSRMGTARVVFKAYQRFQLTEIIEQRLQSTKVFSKDAIRFCASAVAGVSGDCRTALQICRRAVEIAQKDIQINGLSENINNNNNNNKKRAKTKNKNKNKNKRNNNNNFESESTEIVTIEHLKKAKYGFEQSNDIQIVSGLSIYEKLFLTAIVMYNSRSGGFAGTTIAYRQKFNNFIQTRLGDSKLNNVHFRNMIDRLEDMGIIKVTFEKKDWKEFITFNIRNEEAAHALKENDMCCKIISELQTV